MLEMNPDYVLCVQQVILSASGGFRNQEQNLYNSIKTNPTPKEFDQFMRQM